jgi:fumarate reductase flavoprotein subunit
MPVHIDPDRRFATHVPILIVGAGACGAVAALAARASGADVLMLERDATPSGSTALSSGFIPAGGTAQQRARGIDDSPGRFAADIAAKARGRADVTLATAYTDAIPQALDWLERSHGVPFELLEGLVYPGHAVERMHCVPERTGAALLARLHRAASAAGADLVCSARAADLFVDAAKRVRGVRIVRPDGSAEEVGCDALVLACNGFGGDPGLVERYIPEMADAEYFGHRGNDGDALRWAMALGALTADLSGYQGHGSVATPHGVLITWALMMRGAIQVNARGERFANEHDGYSEAAVHVLRQPGRVAFDIYDERLHEFGLGFPDYARAVAAGAIRRGATAAELAAALGIDAAGLERTLAEVDALAHDNATDAFERTFRPSEALRPPYFGVKVGAALFHTQGGAVVDAQCRVLVARNTPLPNLYAAGGAARGVSGDAVWGYLSGNGLLSAVAGGFIAGRAAAASVAR